MISKSYFVKRTAQAIITIIICAALLFFIFYALPGDPAAMMLDPTLTEEGKQQMREMWGLNKPWWDQFSIHMQKTLVFDFGNSFVQGEPVWDYLGPRIPNTLLLFGSATIISWFIGIFLGAIIGWRRGGKLDLGAIIGSLFFWCMPIFWFGLILLWLFAYRYPIFPLHGITTPGVKHPNFFAWLKDLLWHMFLPLISLIVYTTAGHLLLMRNSMIEVLGEDYITTAKAKGLKERTVLYKHAARNALLPVTTALAVSLAFAIAGGVLTETIFSWPGVGRAMIVAIKAHDYPVAKGAFFIIAVLVILANYAADVLYTYLDPRITY